VQTPRLVIGLDTDSRGFHWVSNSAIRDGRAGGAPPQKVGHIMIKGDIDTRRVLTYMGARDLFRVLPPVETHIFCEEPLALQNGKTTRVLGIQAGIIWAGFIEGVDDDHVPRYWYWVDVAHWKKEVCGKGNINKDDIRMFCRTNPGWLNLSRERPGHHDDPTLYPASFTYDTLFEDNLNLYDAWCLMVYGVRQLTGHEDRG